MQTSLFDLENRYASLSEAGDPLERLDAVIDWEIFRPILARIDAKERKTAAGRKPICRVLMFMSRRDGIPWGKLLVLQRLHNISDERLQYQVTDRLSFMRFLGLELSGDVPDARTVWAFREALKRAYPVSTQNKRLVPLDSLFRGNCLRSDHTRGHRQERRPTFGRIIGRRFQFGC